MFQQMSLVDLMAAVQDKIEPFLPCYDVPPDNAPAPFTILELADVQNGDTKTLYCKDYAVWVHIIDDEKASHVPIYNHIQTIEEALSDGIDLPDGFFLVSVTDDGTVSIKTDPSGEKHAVVQFTYKISYAIKIK